MHNFQESLPKSFRSEETRDDYGTIIYDIFPDQDHTGTDYVPKLVGRPGEWNLEDFSSCATYMNREYFSSLLSEPVLLRFHGHSINADPNDCNKETVSREDGWELGSLEGNSELDVVTPWHYEVGGVTLFGLHHTGQQPRSDDTEFVSGNFAQEAVTSIFSELSACEKEEIETLCPPLDRDQEGFNRIREIGPGIFLDPGFFRFAYVMEYLMEIQVRSAQMRSRIERLLEPRVIRETWDEDNLTLLFGNLPGRGLMHRRKSLNTPKSRLYKRRF